MTDTNQQWAVWIVNLLEHDPGQVLHALRDLMEQTPVDQRLDLMRAIDAEVVRRQPRDIPSAPDIEISTEIPEGGRHAPQA